MERRGPYSFYLCLLLFFCFTQKDIFIYLHSCKIQGTILILSQCSRVSVYSWNTYLFTDVYIKLNQL